MVKMTELTGHQQRVLHMAMSPDGNKTLETLAMNARKRIVNLFRISKLKIFRRAALRRHLPRDENRLR
jgi:hypothetical protein